MNAVAVALSKIYDVTNPLEKNGVTFTSTDLKEAAKTLKDAMNMLKAGAVFLENQANKVQE